MIFTKCFEQHHGSPGNGSSGGHTLSGRCCIYKHQTEHNFTFWSEVALTENIPSFTQFLHWWTLKTKEKMEYMQHNWSSNFSERKQTVVLRKRANIPRQVGFHDLLWQTLHELNHGKCNRHSDHFFIFHLLRLHHLVLVISFNLQESILVYN